MAVTERGETKGTMPAPAAAREQHKQQQEDPTAGKVKKIPAGKPGYATQSCIHAYRAHYQIDGDAAADMEPDMDISKPLYFWQLYNVLGQRRIVKLVTNFYTRVYEDEDDPEFKRAFTRISGKEHHIRTQAAFWIDAMGGGRAYHGGMYRVEFHHSHNARQVMTHQGAVRWMHHMRAALDESDLGTDPRVRGVIDDFLFIMMEKYGSQHGFKTGAAVYGKDSPYLARLKDNATED